jgi:hypothetical protein
MCSYGVPSDSKNRSYQNRLIKKLLQDSSAAKKRRETNKQDLDQETVYQEEEEEITNKLLYQKTCDQFFVQERQRDTDTEIGNPKCKYLEIRSKNCLEFDPREENCNKMRTNFALKRTRERDRERDRERERARRGESEARETTRSGDGTRRESDELGRHNVAGVFLYIPTRRVVFTRFGEKRTVYKGDHVQCRVTRHPPIDRPPSPNTLPLSFSFSFSFSFPFLFTYLNSHHQIRSSVFFSFFG